MKNKYSEKELEMFKALGIADILIEHLSASSLYKTIALLCFAENRQGKAVESFRKCYCAFFYGTTYRLTPEFDNLIEL